MPVLRDDTNGNGSEDVACHLTSDLSSAADEYETDSLPQYEGTSLSALCSSDDPTINFICKWSGISCNTAKSVSGLHHILQLPVLSTRRGVGCPLTITSKYKANIYHEFSLGPVVRLLFTTFLDFIDLSLRRLPVWLCEIFAFE